MNDFDWVSARAACSVILLFEKLKLQLQSDIEKRVALRKGPPFFYTFKLVSEGSAVTVVQEGNKIHNAVSFKIADEAIEVVDRDGNVKLSALVALNDDGECVLRHEGQELQLWQFRKKALEALFFSVPESSDNWFSQFGGKEAKGGRR